MRALSLFLVLLFLVAGCGGGTATILGITSCDDSSSNPGNSLTVLSDVQVLGGTRQPPLKISFKLTDAKSDRVDVRIMFISGSGDPVPVKLVPDPGQGRSSNHVA